MEILSYAKVNLFLDIVGVREDGYHLLDMINAKFSLYDSLSIEVSEEPGILLTLSDERIPTGPENTAYKAAHRFLDAARFDAGVRMHIEKRIPFGAGLGGGSSNAATVLLALNQLVPNPLPQEELLRIGQSIGADVPFFLVEGSCYVGGIGEILRPIQVPKQVAAPLHLVLCSPDEQVSTQIAYRFWDESTCHEHASYEEMVDAMRQERWDTIPGFLFNSFEPVIYPAFPNLESIHNTFSTISPTGALLSGSGSNMFSLHTSENEASEVSAKLQAEGLRSQNYRLLV